MERITLRSLISPNICHFLGIFLGDYQWCCVNHVIPNVQLQMTPWADDSLTCKTSLSYLFLLLSYLWQTNSCFMEALTAQLMHKHKIFYAWHTMPFTDSKYQFPFNKWSFISFTKQLVNHRDCHWVEFENISFGSPYFRIIWQLIQEMTVPLESGYDLLLVLLFILEQI